MPLHNFRGLKVYRRSMVNRQSSHYQFHESVNRRVQTDQLVELVALEAPINISHAIRRLAEAWDSDALPAG